MIGSFRLIEISQYRMERSDNIEQKDSLEDHLDDVSSNLTDDLTGTSSTVTKSLGLRSPTPLSTGSSSKSSDVYTPDIHVPFFSTGITPGQISTSDIMTPNTNQNKFNTSFNSPSDPSYVLPFEFLSGNILIAKNWSYLKGSGSARYSYLVSRQICLDESILFRKK